MHQPSIRGAVRGLVLATSLVALTGCGSDDSQASVFSVKVGECFAAPTAVKAQVSDLGKVPCSTPHGHEAYAVVAYSPKDADTYPGEDALDKFARGACAQRFGEYVGLDYLDSTYYFTYLTPSPRSWQEKDRSMLCLVTDAGRPLVGTVKGSGL